MRVTRDLRGKVAATIVCGAATTAACVETSAVDQGVRETAKIDSDALGLSEKALIVPKCKGQGCGDNGIMVRYFKFHELNANGWPNAEGVSLRTYLSPPDESAARIPLRLNVDGDVLTGSVTGTTLGGQDLVGAQMILDRWSDKGTLVESYLLALEQVDIP